MESAEGGRQATIRNSLFFFPLAVESLNDNTDNHPENLCWKVDFKFIKFKLQFYYNYICLYIYIYVYFKCIQLECKHSMRQG